MNAVQPLRFSILGAAGAMGTLFARELKAAGHHVAGFDIHPPVVVKDFDSFTVGDVMRPSPSARDAWRESHVVVISLPHEPALEAIRAVVPLVSKRALVVDTLSVKTPVTEILTATPAECEYLSINPMFAPSLGFTGQKVVAIPYHSGDGAARFMRMMEGFGAGVVQMGAEEHDRACAVMQTATHAMLIALGQVVRDAGFSVDDLIKIAPPPHLMSLGLIARILSAAPEVYWDIQRDNPFAGELRQQLAAALSELDATATANDAAAFGARLAAMRKTFEPKLKALTNMSAEAIKAAMAASR
jgi:prephenate dehydrogenase